MIPVIEKAILVANIGLTPSNNGEHIRLNIPPLTEERRKELVKQIKAETETARVSLRGIRRDLVDAFKKAQKDGMPEDAAKDGEESAQKLTDKYAKKVDDLFSAKEKEIMTVWTGTSYPENHKTAFLHKCGFCPFGTEPTD